MNNSKNITISCINLNSISYKNKFYIAHDDFRSPLTSNSNYIQAVPQNNGVCVLGSKPDVKA